MQNKNVISYLGASLFITIVGNTSAAQSMNLTVPVMQANRFIGEVGVQVGVDGLGLATNSTHLISLFKDKLTGAALQKLKALPAGKLISIQEAKALGLVLRFNMADTVVQASIAGSAKTKTELSLTTTEVRGSAGRGRSPKGVSGYLNVFAVSSASDLNGDYAFSDVGYSFDTALHIAPLAHMTLEAFGSLDADGNFSRGDIRAIWQSDNQNNNWQLRVGDVGSTAISYMSGARLQGVEFTNTDSRRRKRAGVASVGNREFFLERQAVARLLIDDKEVRRFNLEPGPYNVKDFPLANGANNIAFVIEDDRGEVERITFNLFSDASLVAPGEYRYNFSLGHGLSKTGNYHYDSSKLLLSGFLETGITPALSLSGGLQLTEKAQLGVATAKLSTPLGRFDFEAGVTLHDDGANGEAAKITWQNNRNYKEKRNPSTLALSASYQSKNFRGVFDDNRVNEEAWRVDASYSKNIRGVSVALASNYTKNRTLSDAYKHTFSLGKSINKWSIGGDIGYQESDQGSGWEGGLTVGYNFGKTRFRGRYEYGLQGDERTEIDISSDYSKGVRFGNGLLDYRVGLSSNEHGNGSINGDFDYKANRFEFSASHSANIKSLTDSDGNGQRTTLRAGVAVAFAEGKFAVGRPIKDSFAILYPHETIFNKQLLVGNRNKHGLYEAQSDGLGPLLASNFRGSRFQGTDLRYDVNDLPLGYDLGTGLTSITPRYKSGFAVQVGSSYNVIATATLLDAFNRPLKLLLGKATEIGVPEPKTADAFTDDSGQLSVSGLSAGRWKVEMFAKKPVTYMLVIPQGKAGIVELGKLKPLTRIQ